MELVSPGACAFKILGFSIYWYGIIMASAIAIGTFVAQEVYKKYFLIDKQYDLLLDLMPWLVVVGFVGARLYYCILNFSYYIARPFNILNVREGGLSIHGTIFACVVFLFFFAKKKKLNLFTITAPMTLGLALAQSIGRWGNFFNSEAFGRPIESFAFVKLFIPENLRPLQYRIYEYFHPTFLYESILDFCIFIILFFFVRKNPNPLFITSLYFTLYSIVRIFVEYIRVDSVANFAGIPIPIIVSGVILLISLFGIYKSRA